MRVIVLAVSSYIWESNETKTKCVVSRDRVSFRQKRLKWFFFSVFPILITSSVSIRKKSAMATVNKTSILSCVNRGFFLRGRELMCTEVQMSCSRWWSWIQLPWFPASASNRRNWPFPRCRTRALRQRISVASDTSELYDCVLLNGFRHARRKHTGQNNQNDVWFFAWKD